MDAMFYSDTLYAAAVVRFMRTHATGSRIGIPVGWIDALPDHLRVVYIHVKDLRDKFIAHPVAPLEDNQAFIYIKISDEGAGTVADVNLDHGRMLAGGGIDGFALGKLAKSLREKIESEIEVEVARVLEAARTMPIADIMKRDSEQVPAPSMQRVNKGRKPFSGEQNRPRPSGGASELMQVYQSKRVGRTVFHTQKMRVGLTRTGLSLLVFARFTAEIGRYST